MGQGKKFGGEKEHHESTMDKCQRNPSTHSMFLFCVFFFPHFLTLPILGKKKSPKGKKGGELYSTGYYWVKSCKHEGVPSWIVCGSEEHAYIIGI